MTAHSAVYAGPVMHRRIAPVRHGLRYRIFTLLLDLGEIDALSSSSRLFSRNRFNVLSFYDRDHGDGSETPLREQVAVLLSEAGIGPVGAIRLMCMPRIFGYVFNPLSVWFCYRPDGALAATIYEVSNTFGERHSYVIPVDAADDGDLRQSCAKRFYVSPFMDMDMEYKFRVSGPADRLVVGIIGSQSGKPLLAASFCGKRRAFSDAALLMAVITHPLMTLKVVAGIHFEALKLWWKGMRPRPRPPAPEKSATFVQSGLRG